MERLRCRPYMVGAWDVGPDSPRQMKPLSVSVIEDSSFCPTPHRSGPGWCFTLLPEGAFFLPNTSFEFAGFKND